MKLHLFGSRLLRKIPALATALVALLGTQVGSTAFAQDRDPTPVITYTPELVQMQSPLPMAQSYNMAITSPYNLLGLLNLPISFTVTPVGKPAGVSDATAISYVSFSTPGGGAISQLIFTGANQVRTVSVNVNIPANATPGSYGYKIVATGWTVDPLLGLLNVGGFINATTTAAQLDFAPPTVEISDPVDASVLTIAALPVDVTIRYKATSVDPTVSAITSTDVDVNGSAATITSLTGLNTLAADVVATYRVTALGEHTVTARATNSGGTASDTTTFTVELNTPKPTVVINTPTPGSSYNYVTGGPATSVPFSFTGSVAAGSTITALTATMDGTIPINFATTGLNTTSATGTANLLFTSGGTHTIYVTATDAFGRVVDTQTNFLIVTQTPAPSINITTPTDNQVINLPSGTSTTSVNLTFVTTVNSPFVINSVSATIDGNTVNGIVTPGLGTSSTVTSTVTLTGLAAGSHAIVVTGTSSGGALPVTDSTNFRIQSTTVVPPSVVINTPPVNSTYNLVYGGGPLTIPLTFTGTSNMSNGVITQVTAKVNSTTLTTTQTLGTKVVNSSANMVINAAGTYTITVTAKDAYGTATASRTFKVCVVYYKNICGRVFFDINFNGAFDEGDCNNSYNYGCRDYDWNDCRGSRNDRYYDRGDCRDGSDRYYSRDYDDDRDSEDFGLGGITVKLMNSSGTVVATQVTDSSGKYTFASVAPGNYTVAMVVPAGYGATTQTSRAVALGNSNVAVRDFGLGLKFTDIDNLCANGRTSDWWKTQIDKCIKGDKKADVSATNCNNYTKTIGALALSLYDGITIKTVSSTLGSSSSASRDQLSKQLLAAQYNYANGVYINGNKTLTYCFIQWGERVHKNPSKYSTSYCNYTRDWFKAFNNSQGGRVNGPE